MPSKKFFKGTGLSTIFLNSFLKIVFLRVFPGLVKNRSTIWRALNSEYTKKFRSMVISKSGSARRDAFVKYKNESDILFNFLKPDSVLTEEQALFLNDQQTCREKSIMEFLLTLDLPEPMDAIPANEDVGHVEVLGSDQLDIEEEESLTDDSEEEDNDDIDDENDESLLYYKLRSGKRVKKQPDEETIEDDDDDPCRIRIGPKLFSKRVIETIIAMNVRAHITINQARLCFMICENMYHNQNLSLQPSEKPKGIPRTAEEFKLYENVLPSETVLWKFRHKYALCKSISFLRIISEISTTVFYYS